MNQRIARNDNPNPKHIKKRLIAERVWLSSFLAMILLGGMSLCVHTSIDNDVNELKNDQAKIYESFEDSTEFGTKFKQDFKVLSNDYINGNITYDKFEEGLTKLKSQEYVKQVFDQKANEDMTAQLQQLDNKITNLKQNSNRAKASSIIGSLAIASGAVTLGSLVPYSVYLYKEQWPKEERQTKQENEQTL